jgi:hypothetical protein
MTNDFDQIDAQCAASRMAFVTPEEHAEYQAYLDAQAPIQLAPLDWCKNNLGDDDCRKEIIDLLDGNVCVASFHSLAKAHAWAGEHGYYIKNPPAYLLTPEL